MQYHPHDSVTLVCTSDSCFTPIDKDPELAGRVQSLLKGKQFRWNTAISVDHRNCRFVYVIISTVTVINNSCEFRQAKRHTTDSRCDLSARCVAAFDYFSVLLLLPQISGLRPALVVMASDDVPNPEMQGTAGPVRQYQGSECLALSIPLQDTAGRHSGRCLSRRQSTAMSPYFLCLFVTWKAAASQPHRDHKASTKLVLGHQCWPSTSA